MPGVGDEHLFDQVRVADKNDALRAEAEAGDVAVLAGDVDKEIEPAGAKARTLPPTKVPFGPGGSIAAGCIACVSIGLIGLQVEFMEHGSCRCAERLICGWGQGIRN